MNRPMILVSVVFLSAAIAYGEEVKPFVYQDHGKRDPLWSLVTVTGMIRHVETEFSISDMKLEGVMLGKPEESSVIINGRVLQENDKLGDFTVKKIVKDGVLLSKGTEVFELKMKTEGAAGNN
ncbi:MAG: general secretion pathway protein GspB [Candidatus Omnitrophica bacterium]|nr:general secretion pathway protein GspB [Candidatus Omnitrophota bacterium]